MFTELIISAEKCFCGDLRFIGGFSSDPRLIPDMYYCPSLNNPSMIKFNLFWKAPNFLQAFYCTEKSKVTYHLKTPRIGLFVPSVCHGEWLHRTEPMCVGCDHHHITVHAIIIQKVVIATFWDFQSARWPACGPVPVVAHYRINTKELLPELTMKSSWRS